MSTPLEDISAVKDIPAVEVVSTDSVPAVTEDISASSKKRNILDRAVHKMHKEINKVKSKVVHDAQNLNPLKRRHASELGASMNSTDLNTGTLFDEQPVPDSDSVILDTTETVPTTNNPMNDSSVVPKIVFLVPYRDRESQRQFYLTKMKTIMADYDPNDYKILFVNQGDKRSFNRGAMKNIGFLIVKDMFPNDYKNITLVFNDVDTTPTVKNLFNYQTTQGVVKHFYGFTYALGGIVSILGQDFEKIDGFPNYWNWGYEDNALNERVLTNGLTIDRSVFFPINSPMVIQLNETSLRSVNKKEFDRYMGKVQEGIHSIRNLVYKMDSTGFANVTNFNTEFVENTKFTKMHDLKNGNRPFSMSKRNSMELTFSSPFNQPTIADNILSPQTVSNAVKTFNMLSGDKLNIQKVESATKTLVNGIDFGNAVIKSIPTRKVGKMKMHF